MNAKTAPLARQCATGKRRKNRRKQSGAEKAAPEKRIGNKDGNQSDDGRIPNWIRRQALAAAKVGQH
jgi:hypothetical protein